jgi:phosphatidylethanolamine-binding protein (PEBP) family uncharacterized protein
MASIFDDHVFPFRSIGSSKRSYAKDSSLWPDTDRTSNEEVRYYAVIHHWIVYNIPASARQLQGNHAFTEGTNSFGFTSYGGPCPPPTGETHHYLFLLYATNLAHVGAQGLKFGQVVSTLQGHVLGATSIIGTFHLPQ